MIAKSFTLDETQYKKIVEALLQSEGLGAPGLEFQRLFNAGVGPFRVVSIARMFSRIQGCPPSELSGRLNKHFLTKRCGNRG